MRRIVSYLPLIATLSFASCAAVEPAAAQTAMACGQRQLILDALKTDYNEDPIAQALDNGGGVLEVLATPNGSTWTILRTTPDGLTCMVAEGIAWENLPAAFGIEY